MKIKILEVVLISLLLVGIAINVPRATSVVSKNKELNVPMEYRTIQEAINVANPGDIIRVSNGTYYERLAITKDCLTLIGENPNTTIIDGNQNGTVIKVSANNVTITGFTIRRSGDGENGIFLYYSGNSTIVGNMIHNCYVGIRLHASCDNKIIENGIANNSDSGIILQVHTINTLISKNNITSNRYVGINVFAYADNNTIEENIITGNLYAGIHLYLASGNRVNRNILMRNDQGIRFVGHRATYNTISDNAIAENTYGIDFWDDTSWHNIIYHNNIIDNTYQLYLESLRGNLTKNQWNNEANEGNYWSDYEGEDIDSDGVGETNTPHLDVDSYPLANPEGPIPVISDGQLYQITIRSNSVLSRFLFNQASKEIDFKIIGPASTMTHCNITIPKGLLSPATSQSWALLLDGANLGIIVTENATFTSLYFAHNQSAHTHVIKIKLETNVNPIFYGIGMAIALILATGMAIVLIALKQKRKNQRSNVCR